MSTRHVVLATLLLTPSLVVGQAPDDWREPFAAGEEARRSGDHEAYRRHMTEAARLLPQGHLNRPFVQYHAARASALAGREADAVAWLRTAWEEEIEALMISFAAHDPAFDSVREAPGFVALMSAPATMRLEVEPLADGLYLVRGTGSNVVAQVGPDGVLLVDTGYGPALPALRAALQTLEAGPVTRVVVTHPHEDHMGSAAELGASAIVVAHPGTAAAMREPYVFMDGVTLPPKAEAALPDVEVARDTTFTFNGATVRVVPTVAHSAGDVTVYFAEARVAHFGDAYLGGNPMMFPGQADPAGFLDRLEALVDDMHPETVVIGGHDGPVGLDEVRGQIAESRACMAHARQAVEEGASLEAAVASAEGRFPPQWIAFFYRVLSSP